MTQKEKVRMTCPIDYLRLRDKLKTYEKLLVNVRNAIEDNKANVEDDEDIADMLYNLSKVLNVSPGMVQMVDDKFIVIFNNDDDSEIRIPIKHANNVRRDIIAYFHYKVAETNAEISKLVFDERGFRKKEYPLDKDMF